jgi:hypothetical protein
MHRLVIQRIFYLIFFVSFRLWLAYTTIELWIIYYHYIKPFINCVAQNLEYLDTQNLDYI